MQHDDFSILAIEKIPPYSHCARKQRLLVSNIQEIRTMIHLYLAVSHGAFGPASGVMGCMIGVTLKKRISEYGVLYNTDIIQTFPSKGSAQLV